MEKREVVAIVGLGYVGLPLAVAFGRLGPTIGLDLNEDKLAHYRRGSDPGGEVEAEELARAEHLEFTSDARRLADAAFIIVVVPTPIDAARRPDLGPLERLPVGWCQSAPRGDRGIRVNCVSRLY